MNEDTGKLSPSERTLRIPVLLRFFFQGRAIAGLTLPEGTTLEEIDVPVVALDAPRKLRTAVPVTFPRILVPSYPDRWVLLPTIDHARGVRCHC